MRFVSCQAAAALAHEIAPAYAIDPTTMLAMLKPHGLQRLVARLTVVIARPLRQDLEEKLRIVLIAHLKQPLLHLIAARMAVRNTDDRVFRRPRSSRIRAGCDDQVRGVDMVPQAEQVITQLHFVRRKSENLPLRRRLDLGGWSIRMCADRCFILRRAAIDAIANVTPIGLVRIDNGGRIVLLLHHTTLLDQSMMLVAPFRRASPCRSRRMVGPAPHGREPYIGRGKRPVNEKTIDCVRKPWLLKLTAALARFIICRMQPPLDPYAALFSAAEVADICGIPRAILDVWVTRKVIEPTRRQRPAARKRYSSKRKKVTPRVGRPLFACRDVFKALLVRVLADEQALASPESSVVATLAELAKVADGGEWMWAVARSIERKEPLSLYAYANRHGGEWRLDMHIGALGAAPCFGWNVPNVFIPVSDIFAEAYRGCRQVVGDASDHGAHS